MGSIRIIIVLVFLAVAMANSLATALIINNRDGHARRFVDIVGEIHATSDQNFATQTALIPALLEPDQIIVTLSSPGGNAVAGMKIGELIHKAGWATYVPSEIICASACALIWLSGTPRYVAKSGARIGMHAAYDERTMQVSGVGNAVVGAYITKLGLGYETVICATAPPPTSIGWLTPEDAKQCGISYEILDPPRGTPPITPVARSSIELRTAIDLHIRVEPDPHAADIFGPPLNGIAPAGSLVGLVSGFHGLEGVDCKVWSGSGRGAQDADNVWCPVAYQDIWGGWANAYYLIRSDGQRYACVLFPEARGCMRRRE